MTDPARLFPSLDDLVFFNHAAVAPLSGPAVQALHEYADHAGRRGPFQGGWYEKLDQLRERLATMIHARGPHEIAFVPNTSTGLSMVANGLDWREGDRVVVSSVEYPANRYPWENLTRFGVEIREVPPHEDHRIDVEDVIDAINDRTRIVSLSHVQYSTGYRINLKPISDMVHQAGGYLNVDGIQSVGAMPVDVQAMGVDFLSADGHKWMLGPEGAGFFYCREDLVEWLRPSIVGWLNMANAQDFSHYDFAFRQDARRFEPGSWNIPGLLALNASVQVLIDEGLDNVWSKIDVLNANLRIGLKSKGYRVISPDGEDERSGIVTFMPQREDISAKQVAGELEKQGVVVAVRMGRLRSSLHFYNREDQVDRLLDALPTGG